MEVTDLLYDHYKETCATMKKSNSERNRLLITLMIVVAALFLFTVSPDNLLNALKDWLKDAHSISIDMEYSIVQSLLWIVLLYFTIRYYQINTSIERQYNYIHKLEDMISSRICVSFDREGKSYLTSYPKLLDFISFLYRAVIPMLYLAVVLFKIGNEIYLYEVSFPLVIDCILALCCTVLTVLYLYFLHRDYLVNKIKAWFCK